MICLFVFLGVFNVENHPRYEEVKTMFIEGMKRHPEVKMPFGGVLMFDKYFLRGEFFIEVVWEDLVKEIGKGRYKHIWDVLTDTMGASAEAKALYEVQSMVGGSDIVMGEIVKVFPDTVRICRYYDKNYLLRVDRVFQGGLRPGDTIQIKFFGNVLAFSPSGPDYRFMGGDTIIASLVSFAPSCIKGVKDRIEIGYKLPFYLAGVLKKVTGLRVSIKDGEVEKERVGVHIEGYKFRVPLDATIYVIERLVSVREKYFNLLYDRMTPALMDSFFVYLKRRKIEGKKATVDGWYVGLNKWYVGLLEKGGRE